MLPRANLLTYSSDDVRYLSLSNDWMRVLLTAARLPRPPVSEFNSLLVVGCDFSASAFSRQADLR